MKTDELLEQVLEMKKELDDLTEKIEVRSNLARRKIGELESALEEKNRQFGSQENQEIQEEKEKAQALIAEKEKVLQNIDIMTKRLTVQYEKKYGKLNRKAAPRKMNMENLRAVFQRVTDPSFAAFFKRMFSLGGYKSKKEMYQDFLFAAECYRSFLENENRKTEEDQNFQISLIHDTYGSKRESARKECESSTRGIQRQCSEEQEQWTREIQSDVIGRRLAEYDRQTAELLSVFPVSEHEWDKYTETNDPKPELYFGDIAAPWMSEEQMNSMFGTGLRQAAPHTAGNGSVLVPYIESVTGGLCLFVEYDVNDGWAGNWIQSLLLQLIHGMPLYRYQMRFFDAEQNGRDLGDMTMLNSISDKEIEDIHPGLKYDEYHILNLCQDKEDIRECMQELSEFMKKVSVLLGRTDSVEEFNRNNEKIIPYQVIVFQNFPSGMEDETLEKFKAMVRQGKRFGFSFVILGRNGVSNYFSGLTENSVCIRVSRGNAVIQKKSRSYPVSLKKFPPDSCKSAYLGSLNKMFLSSFQDMDNRFGSCIPYEDSLPVRDSTEKMMIPFAINRRGRTMELELGSSLTTHGLLSGGIGSGKTTTLHAIINSVMLHYRPEDVQMWLVDYKMAEFAIYAQNTPAHIGLVGVQDSQEFTFAFLDYVTAEYERRMQLFKEATKEKGVAISSMREYRKHYGRYSMPRILIIIDEFHKMTQYIQDNEYKEVLENHLAEVRACGITYLFADQTVSVGLRGLTEKGRRQIMVRMAMKQGGSSPETEIVETIGIEREQARQMNDVMDLGHVLFQQQVSVMEADGRTTAKKMLLHCRALWLSGEEQRKIALKLIDAYGSRQDLVCVDGREAKERDEETIQGYLEQHADEDTASQFAIVPGTPVNLDPCMVFWVNRNYNQNMICIGEKTELRLRVLMHTVYSLRSQGAKKIYFAVEENDVLFRGENRRKIRSLEGNGVRILTDYGDICRMIDSMKRRISRRQRGRDRTNEDIFLFWIGLDNMLSLFQTLKQTEYPAGAKKKKKKEEAPPASDMDSLTSMFDSMFPGVREEAPAVRQEEEPEEEEPEELYNACDDITTIMSYGSKNGIFSYVTYSAVTPLNTYKRIVNVERFLHRIALKMDEISSADFLNNKSKMASSELSPGQAVYYDGGRTGRYFIPYK